MAIEKNARPGVFDLPFQHRDVDSKIVAAQERVAQAFRVLRWRAAKEHGLSPLQLELLVFLLHHDRARSRVSRLAEELDVTKPTVSDALAALESKGLIGKRPSVEDGRSVFVALTRKGRSLSRRLEGWADEGRAALSSLPHSDRLTVQRFLMRWIEELQMAGLVTVARMCVTCRFYQDDRCVLLETPLPPEALRVDCPVHEPKPPLRA
jgi:DNA-binding MarR family transcriptional regulator